MDATDERVLMPATPHDAVNAIMSDMQGPQGFLASLEDPSALLTYFINENEGCSSIVSAMEHANHSSMQGSHDHAYSRLRSEPTTTSSSSTVNSNTSYASNNVSIQAMDIQMNNNALGDGSHLMSHLTSHDNFMSQPVSTYPEGLLGCPSTTEAHNSDSLFSSSSNSTINRSHVSEALTSVTSLPKASLESSVNTHVNSIAVVSKINDEIVAKSNDNKLKPNAIFIRHQSSTPAEHSHAKSRCSQAKNTILGQALSQHSPSSQTSKPAATSNTPQASAELRTVITFKIVDQIVYQGQVVKETILKDEEVVKQCGTVLWPESATPTLSSISRSSTQCISSVSSGALADSESGDTGKSTVNANSSLQELIFNHHNSAIEHEPNRELFSKLPVPISHKSLTSSSDIHHVASEIKTAPKKTDVTEPNTVASTKRRMPPDPPVKRGRTKDDKEMDSEEARRETASALLSLQGNQGVRGNKCSPATPSLTEPEFRPITQGARVLAKWTDKNFYPGVVASFQGDNRWLVHFDDGGKRTIHENEIISVPYLSAGNKVMVTYSPGYCSHGVITAVEVKGDTNVLYTVEYYESEKKARNKFCSGDIFLTPDIAAWLIGRQNKSPQNTEFAGVDLSNIIPKTARVSKQTSSSDSLTDVNNSVENQTTVIKNIQARKEKRACTWAREPECSDTGVANSKQSKCVYKESSPPSRTGSSGSSLRSINSISKTLPPVELEKLLGPLPPEGSQLFKGIGFLLATGDMQPFTETICQDAGKSTLLDVPYLIKQIEAGSGRYFENFEEKLAAKDVKETVLIAYTYTRAVEYMQCLAAGIPCVTHTWVVDCCRQNHLLKKEGYLLPSGYSIIHNKLFSDRNVFKKSSTVFKGTKVMFAPSKSKLAEKWTPVLEAANATIISSLPTFSGTSTRKSTNSLDIIIADPSCPSAFVSKVQQMKIPIVSSEYIVQCLIHGRKLPIEAHEKFHFNAAP